MCEVYFWILFFFSLTYGCPVVPAPVIEKTVLSLALYASVKTQSVEYGCMRPTLGSLFCFTLLCLLFHHTLLFAIALC